MTRDQHLEFCNRCKNRKFDAMHGTICGITSRVADFENTCENFDLDESVKIEKPQDEEKVVPNFKYVAELSESVKVHLRGQQDVLYAIIGGLAAAIVGALLWAVITVTTKYQIGYMAIGVGFLVGFAVRFYGAGIDKYFGIIGAFFALLGCALGNLLSQVAFIADAQSMGYFETLTMLDLEIIIGIFEETFSPMDVLFYGIAAYEGFKFAFRNVTDDLIRNIDAGKIDPPPFTQFRLPTVVALFLLLSVGGFFVSRGTVGVKTFYYEGGAKRSMGELVNGKENGPWESWWENGKLQYKGFFTNGKQDSSWKFYDEEGVLFREGSFKQALMHGSWTDYYADGQKTNSGHYQFGRLSGLWTYYFPNGKISQKGFYQLDLQDSTWETYYDNGTMASKGSYTKGIPSGDWTNWNEEGVMSQQLQYTADGTQRVLNTWSLKGKPEVANGNGTFKLLHTDGTVMETCTIKDGNKNGSYRKYYPGGKVEEEGEYREGTYYLVNAWNSEGTQTIVKGEGSYENRSGEDIMFVVSGLVKNGLRTGKWTVSSEDNKLNLQESNYVEGKLEGPNNSYFEDGTISVEGSFTKDKREGKWTWYHQTGAVESVINYVDNKKEGDQYFYTEEGDLLRTEVYKNGKLVETKVPE
jgi:antitoxin component YwqK of YwqJK toxin-antitoxin module